MINCQSCGKTITEKNDINFLALLLFFPVPFCNNCYSSKERGFLRHYIYFPRQPINSSFYVTGLWVGVFAIIPMMFVIGMDNTKLSEVFVMIVPIWYVWLSLNIYQTNQSIIITNVVLPHTP